MRRVKTMPLLLAAIMLAVGNLPATAQEIDEAGDLAAVSGPGIDDTGSDSSIPQETDPTDAQAWTSDAGPEDPEGAAQSGVVEPFDVLPVLEDDPTQGDETTVTDNGGTDDIPEDSQSFGDDPGDAPDPEVLPPPEVDVSVTSTGGVLPGVTGGPALPDVVMDLPDGASDVAASAGSGSDGDGGNPCVLLPKASRPASCW